MRSNLGFVLALIVILSSPAFGQNAGQKAVQRDALGQEPDEKLDHAIPSLDQTNIDAPMIEVTLESAVNRAIEQATAVQRAKNNNELTGTELVQGYAQFLPNLEATVGFNNVEGTQYLTTTAPTLVDGHSHGLNYQVSSTLNLFNGFSDISNFKAALARRSSSNLSLRRAKQQIALDVAQSYLQVVLDKQIVKIAERNVASSREREKLLSAQSRVGTKSVVDLYRQQAQTSSDESYLSDSKNKERTDELLLLRKLRYDPNGRFSFKEEDVSGSPAGLEAYSNEAQLIKVALDNRPDLKAQDETNKAYHSEVGIAEAGFYPKIDFSLGVSGSGRTMDSQSVNNADVLGNGYTSASDQLHYSVWTAGVTLTWGIFDRWLTKTNVERANVTARNSSIDLEDLHNQVVGEVRQAYGDYYTVLQQLDSSAKGLQAAKKSYDATNARYKVGAASFIDLLTAQAALVQADAARAQALISYSLKSKVLETVTGVAKVAKDD